MKTVFEYLIEQEKASPGFRFDRTSNQGMVISYPGYKHMELFRIRDELCRNFKLKLDLDKGYEEFDKHSGITYCYFKDVYTAEV